MIYRRRFKRGDLVVFAKDKRSTCPGPRAHEVHPARYGEGYLYKVDKFWMIGEDERDGSVILITRRGRTHRINVSDPRLHRASLWQRLRHRHKFPCPDVLRDQHHPDTSSTSHA